MKRILALSAILFSHTAWCQQASAPLVSLAGIGPVKLGMKKEALDKLLPQPVKLRNLLQKEWNQDTVRFQQAGIDYEVVLSKSIDEKDEGAIIVYAVYSSSPLLKTRSGIGIGDDKIKIVSTYEDYMLNISPDYDPEKGTKIKSRSTVTLHGEEVPAAIIFHLQDNKVTGFWVMYQEGC